MDQPSSPQLPAAGGRTQQHWEALKRGELEHQVQQLHRAAGAKQWRAPERVGLWVILRELWKEWGDRQRYFKVSVRWPWDRKKAVRPR